MISQDWRATVPGASAAPPYAQEQAYLTGRKMGDVDRRYGLYSPRVLVMIFPKAEQPAFLLGYEHGRAAPPTDPPDIL